MESLHELLALHLKGKLEENEVTPALLNVIRQFLKDNNINCDGPSNTILTDLVSQLPDASALEEAMRDTSLDIDLGDLHPKH
jgi:hypothetical protein